MSWFLLTLIGPFLYAMTNYIDKVLLEKYFKEGGVGTLMIFSSLLSALALPFLLFADPSVLDVSFKNILVLMAVGIFNVLVLWFYFLALKDEEASVTVVFYQLVPVLGLVLGYFILGESISEMQFISMLIIIFGTTIISFEVDSENKFKLRKQTIIYMLAASFFWALGSVVFKSVALEENVLRSLFWEHLVLSLIGVFLFSFVGSYRKSFLLAIKMNSKKILSLNVLNEILYITGSVVFSFAYLLAPISLVLLTNSFQPIFVLVIGVFLTIFFPSIAVEKIQVKNMMQKVLAICITGIGTYLLLST